MENQQEMTKITDNLLNVFNYTFVERVPYAFFIPKEDKYVAVHLVDKVYHCQHCGKKLRVNYRQTGSTYFSKGRLARERQQYDKQGLAFPTMGELADGVPFSCQAMGYCQVCAPEILQKDETAGQQIYNLAQRLHREDELLVAKAREAMGIVIRVWLDDIKVPAQLLCYDLSSDAAIRDLLCAVVLGDTGRLTELLGEYQDTVHTLRAEIERLNAAQPAEWQAYSARSTAVYESMSDELYHEYTVAFPAEGTVGEDFYLLRKVERDKVTMFLRQPRITTLEELLMEAGFQGEWLDWLMEKAKGLQV